MVRVDDAMSALVRRAPRSELRKAADGGRKAMEIMLALAGSRRTVLSELVAPEQGFHDWQHLPRDDAHDARLGFRYYYHCHGNRETRAGEHGHFHLFADAVGSGVTHLVAIAVDAHGQPTRLFTTNRWVTGERWRTAPRVLEMLDRFALRRPAALRRVSAWLAAMVRMYRPQLNWLLRARDARLRDLRSAGRKRVMDDRRVAVLSECRISIPAQAAALDAALLCA